MSKAFRIQPSTKSRPPRAPPRKFVSEYASCSAEIQVVVLERAVEHRFARGRTAGSPDVRARDSCVPNVAVYSGLLGILLSDTGTPLDVVPAPKRARV